MASDETPRTESGTFMPPFERPLSIYKVLYDDDIESMKLSLPELMDKCKLLGETQAGKNYSNLRLPVFILASNKLEGTSSPNASEGETFKIILDFLKHRSDKLDDFDDDNQVHQIPWDEEGQNTSNDAWYAQCKAHVMALVMMTELAREGKPLDTVTLLRCHNLLMNGAASATNVPFESRFRGWDEPVVAGNYIFPNQTNHEQNLAAKLEQINSTFETKHPVDWACDLLLAVLTLHPFLNGNGRLARLCFAYGLMRHGVPCAVVFSDWHSKSHSHYIRAVQEGQGQKSQDNKYEKLHCMATVGLFHTLKNMVTFCEISNNQN
ncbi:hypothetical protein ACA910_020188 [Epithemia clementina (nom. ined.)]